MKIQLCTTAALLAVTSLPTFAAEYFVTKQGNDANNGTSKPTAFLTIKKGVETLQPGDTLTVGRGEYFESITRDGLGSMDAQTTIRAEIPGSVVLRGDVDLPSSAFKKVDGYRYVYVANFDREVQAVNEVDSLTRMEIFPTIKELEFAPGTTHYDAERKLLYISTGDLQPPSAHQYTVSVTQATGLMLLNPRRVTVDGIAVTGFQSNKLLKSYPERFTTWGIMLAAARGCVIRNCVAYFNGGGLSYSSDKERSKDGNDNGWNLFEKCVAYANGSKFGGSGGNILGFTSNHDEMRDSIAYRGGPNGLRFYGAGIRGPAVMKNNLGWGNESVDIFIKGGEAHLYGQVENSIALGEFDAANVKNSLIGTTNKYNQKPEADTLTGVYSEFGNQETLRTRRDQWFADAENLDFRLQSTSPLRGTGPNKADRGPYPYQPNIFYITAKGKDSNDGLSTKNAWKTLAHAMKKLRAGDTLYLESGTYDAASELKISNAEGQSTSIRARGNSTVLIRGNIAVLDSKGLEFERLNFTGALSLNNSKDIKFNNCRFSNQSTPLVANAVENLKVTHSEFTGFNQAALQLEKSTQVWLSANIFDNKTIPAIQTDSANAILYSDYNSYANTDNTWRVGGAALKLAALPDHQDEYSVARTPEYSLENGLPRLQNASSFSGGGMHGTALGFYRAYQRNPLPITAPHLYSVSATTANIEWWTGLAAQTEIAWGETPDTPNKAIYNEGAFSINDGFNTMSLTGLKPNTRYYFRLVLAKPLGQEALQYTSDATPPKDALISFQTAPAPVASRVLYVAPDGDDNNSGLSRAQAWRTVGHAGDVAQAGDTVQIAGGTYVETVRVRATGTADKPITFKAAPGEKVVFDGNKRAMATAFAIVDKQHINLDGLYFYQFGNSGWQGVVDIRMSDQIQVTRCFFNAFGAGTPGTQLRSADSSGLTIRNNVVTRGFGGFYLRGGTDIKIENNVFLNNLIYPFLSSSGAEKSLVAKNNIFVDSIPSKVKVQMFELGGFERYVFENNAFHLRIGDAERKPFLFYGTGPGRMSVGDYETKTGNQNLVIADPQFAISQRINPVTKDGKKIEFLGDWVPRPDLDFNDVFTNNTQLTNANIGLEPEAFEDFHFHKTTVAKN